MPPQLNWLVKPAVTAFYGAGLSADDVARGQPLAAALAAPAAALHAACTARQVPFNRLLGHLMFLAADNASPAEMTARALTKAAGPAISAHIAELTPLVVGLVEALAKAEPKLDEELHLRAGPLGEQWEARGPGLMSQLARLTEPEVLVAQAAVLPVYPLRGGGGRALIAYNSVAIEAVLANPRPELPEVVRLGWLLAMLNFDLARYCEPLTSAEQVLPLAMIPPVLAAAAEVELARCEPGTVTLALTHWHTCANERPAVAEILMAWWQTCIENPPAWTVALAALEQMLLPSLEQ